MPDTPTGKRMADTFPGQKNRIDAIEREAAEAALRDYRNHYDEAKAREAAAMERERLREKVSEQHRRWLEKAIAYPDDWHPVDLANFLDMVLEAVIFATFGDPEDTP